VILRRRQFLFRELGNFLRQAVDLAAGLLDQVLVNVRIGADAHGEKPRGKEREAATRVQEEEVLCYPAGARRASTPHGIAYCSGSFWGAAGRGRLRTASSRRAGAAARRGTARTTGPRAGWWPGRPAGPR